MLAVSIASTLWQAVAVARPDANRITLMNHTDAVIRVEAGPGQVVTVLEIGQAKELPLAEGIHGFFVTSYLDGVTFSQVVEVNTFEPEGWVRRESGGGLILRLIPRVFDRNLLSNVARRDAPAADARDVENASLSSAEQAGRCAELTPAETRRGLIMWSERQGEEPVYMLGAGNLFCALDGGSFFVDGLFLKRHRCTGSWLGCERDPTADAMKLQVFYTAKAIHFRSEAYRKLAVATNLQLAQTSRALPLTAAQEDIWLTEFTAPNGLDEECPRGFRLHYQGLCINIADERTGLGSSTVRTSVPRLVPRPAASSGSQ